MRRVVFFDLDGTLIDSRHDISTAFAHAAATLRPDVPVHADAITRRIGRPLVVIARELGLGLEKADEPAFEAAYRARFDALACGSSRAHPGIEDLLGRLRACRTVGVVTAKIAYQAEAACRLMGLRDYLHHVQGWAPGLRPKPAPDLLDHALAAVGAAPDEALYVGDTREDVMAARAAGIASIGVTWGFGAEDELAGAAPDRLARTVGELEGLLLG